MDNPGHAVEIASGELVDADTPLPVLGGVVVSPAEQATMEVDEQEAAEHLASLTETNTLEAYLYDWNAWNTYRAWRAAQGDAVHEFGGSPGTLTKFIRWMDEVQEWAPKTIERRLEGVITTMFQHGVEVSKKARADTRVKINKLKQDPAKKKRGRGRADALQLADLRKLVHACDVTTLRGKRDRAILLVSYAYASRVSEVSRLDIDSVTIERDALIVDVPPVKLRNGASMRSVTILASGNPDSPTCPHRAWTEYVRALSMRNGPAWRPIKDRRLQADRLTEVASPNRLSTKGCQRILHGLCQRAGIDPYLYLPWHSLRAGLITDLAEADVPKSKIREISGHAEGSTVLDAYIRHAQRKSHNALKVLDM